MRMRRLEIGVGTLDLQDLELEDEHGASSDELATGALAVSQLRWDVCGRRCEEDANTRGRTPRQRWRWAHGREQAQGETSVKLNVVCSAHGRVRGDNDEERARTAHVWW